MVAAVAYAGTRKLTMATAHAPSNLDFNTVITPPGKRRIVTSKLRSRATRPYCVYFYQNEHGAGDESLAGTGLWAINQDPRLSCYCSPPYENGCRHRPWRHRHQLHVPDRGRPVSYRSSFRASRPGDGRAGCLPRTDC